MTRRLARHGDCDASWRRAVVENTLVAQSLEQLHAEQDKDQGKPNSFWQTTVKGIVNFLTGRAQKEEEEEADSESKPDDNPKNSKSDTAIHEYTKVGQSTTLNVLRPALFGCPFAPSSTTTSS